MMASGPHTSLTTRGALYAVVHLNEITQPIGVLVTRIFYGETKTSVFYIPADGHAEEWKAKPFLSPEQTKAEFLKFLLDVR